MLELPNLTPEHFEILVVRELRKAGLDVSELRIHRRLTLPEPEQGYLLELKGVLSRATWRRRALIACRRQAAPIGPTEIAWLRDHLEEAHVDVGLLFATAPFAPDAVSAAHGGLALLRVTDGRTAFDTSGWGTPGHYPAWLPAYCAQTVGRDATGDPIYRLLEQGQGDVIVNQLGTERRAPGSTAPGAPGAPGQGLASPIKRKDHA
jgi:hypothetical protein